MSNGKGDKWRPTNFKKFQSNWEKIFKKDVDYKKKKEYSVPIIRKGTVNADHKHP